MLVEEGLLNYATARQLEILEVLRQSDTYVAAAKKLDITAPALTKTLKALKSRAIRQGYLPGKSPYMADLKPKLLYIPDIQAKSGIDMLYIHCIGEYIIAKKPTIIVCAGDFADMSSLSSYDKGKRSYEGARYKNDIEAAITAMRILLDPIRRYNVSQKAKNLHPYEPEMVMTLGNHEDRIDRATQLDAMLYGTISIADLKYKEFGWKVYPFKTVVVIQGIAFSHYFPTGLLGKPCSTAQQQLNKMHMSCISGHQQGRQTATSKRADGQQIISIIAGSAYDYEMEYLGAQGNNHWRGVIMLHNLDDGKFDEVYVPIEYLKERYGRDVKPMWCLPEMR